MSYNQIKSEFDENIDVSVKVERCDLENDVQYNNEITEHIENIVKEEPEALGDIANKFLQNKNAPVNQDIEGLYKDHVIKEELVIGPVKIHKIKEELDDETNQDKDTDNKKNHNDAEGIMSDTTKHNRILKKELIASCPNTPQQYLKMKIKREKDEFDGSFSYQVVKEELDWNQIEEVDQCLNTEKTEKNAGTKNSAIDFKIHVVKEEMINDSKGQESDDASHNNNEVPEPKDDKGFRCHICFKTFSFANNLTRHSKVHSDKKPHKCPECDLAFARKDYLMFHLQRHHSYKSNKPQYREPAICDLCKKEFSKKCTRDFHTKHSCPMNKNRIRPVKNKLYICDVCDMVYVYRSSLAAHILRRHSNLGLGPKHECGYCGKKYVKKHNLQCHIQSLHMKIRPYKCRKCKEAFTWHSCLAMHERKVHGKAKKKRF